MKALLEIPDKKVASILDVLQSISYLKVIPLTDEKSLFLQEFMESVREVNEIKERKKNARSAREFLNAI